MNEFLPIEKTQDISKTKFIWSIVFSIALLIFTNILVVILFSFHNPNRGYDVMQLKWRLAQEKHDVEFLILGDSAGNQGFNNEVFDSILNTSSLNLCTTGDMLLKDDYWLLETYLKNNTSPKNIILIHAYDVLKRNEIPQSSFNQIPIDLRHSNLKSNYNFDPLRKYLPLAYQKSSLIHALKNPQLLFKAPYRFSKKGQQIVLNNYPDKLEKDIRYHAEKTKIGNENISDENILALEALSKLANKYNTKLYYMQAPLLDQLLDNKEFTAHYDQVIHNLKTELNKSGVQLIFDDVLVFKDHHMESSIDHITYEASKTYTKLIANELKDIESKIKSFEEK